MIRRTAWLVIGIVGIVCAACASSKTMEPLPADAQRTHPDWLVGTWQGTGYMIPSSTTPAQGTITIKFEPDGTWKANTATGTSTGASWLVGDQIVLDGTMANGAQIRYTLKVRDSGGAREMWGVLTTSFGTATVSLKPVP